MKPLSGIRIAVTRPAAQSAELANSLERAGAEVHVCPLIRTQAVAERARVDRVMSHVSEYTWLVFTSVNGVEHFTQLLHAANIPVDEWRACRVACVGPITAAAAEKHGFPVVAVPADHVGTAVAHEMRRRGDLRGQKILIARAAGGGEDLPRELRAAGAEVDDLELYRSVMDLAGAARLAELVSRGRVDLLTFTSGSAVTYFVDQVGTPANMAVAVIGPSTAQVARRLGLRVDIEADSHTTAGLTEAILEYYAAAGGESEV